MSRSKANISIEVFTDDESVIAVAQRVLDEMLQRASWILTEEDAEGWISVVYRDELG